ncbi:hypothetical protein FOCC_FOCC015568 [Frankliniella occidentalis]|nr:hypothetical protein FOCC_FOCC015568 [Frankliniella occidentalis]
MSSTSTTTGFLAHVNVECGGLAPDFGVYVIGVGAAAPPCALVDIKKGIKDFFSSEMRKHQYKEWKQRQFSKFSERELTNCFEIGTVNHKLASSFHWITA